ncbi:hypothetical protein [uncultured Corynebacterium sp.]|uniref:hypothetical protein n=1 Tax=uncultured Corynebacterium sp. TaxID=159447 RepID=UPI0025D7E695|nr:hypothetical protein [uncultured Corynebacterium sp.]
MITSWTEVTDRTTDHSRNVVARCGSFRARSRGIGGETRLTGVPASGRARIVNASPEATEPEVPHE